MKRFLAAGVISGVVSVISTIGMVGCTAQTTSPSVTTTSEGQKSQAPPGTTAARQDTALVRFINADPAVKGPGAQGLDIWSGTSRTFSNVAYKAITPYVELPAHAGRFDLRASGGATNLAVGLREIFPGRHYTLVALPTQKDRSRLAVITDDLSAVEPGQARVRLINATTGVGDLDLFFAGTKTRIQHGIDASTISSFSEVDPGTLEIRAESKAAVAPLSNLKVEPGRLYTFIVTGTPGSLDVVRVEDRIEGAGSSDHSKSQS